jgi:hypothetical protein
MNRSPSPLTVASRCAVFVPLWQTWQRLINRDAGAADRSQTTIAKGNPHIQTADDRVGWGSVACGRRHLARAGRSRRAGAADRQRMYLFSGLYSGSVSAQGYDRIHCCSAPGRKQGRH